MSITVPRGSLATGSRFASRRTSIATVLSSGEERIEDLTDVELKAAIEKLSSTNHQLSLENAVFEHFVARVDPAFIEGLEQAVTAAAQAEAAQNRALAVAAAAQPTPTLASLAVRRGTDESLGSPRHSVRGRSPSVMRYGSLVGAKEAKLSVKRKLELASRQTEELEKALARAQAGAEMAHRDHAARTAQLRVSCEQVQLAATECAQLKAKGRRLAAQDFVDWLSTWLAKSEACAERLRLRADTLRATDRRLRRRFETAARADAVRGVDVDRLHIDVADRKRRLSEANHDLSLLNEATGHRWQTAARHADATATTNPKLTAARTQYERTDRRVDRATARARQVGAEVDALRMQLGVLRQLQENYTSPDVGDYLRLKAEVGSLHNEMKTLRRRMAVENIGQTRTQVRKSRESKPMG